jgi:hypothetical protein
MRELWVENWRSCISIAIDLLAKDKNSQHFGVSIASFNRCEYKKGECSICIRYISTTFSNPSASFSSGMNLETQSCPPLRHYTSLYYNSVCSKLHVDKRAVSFLKEAQ